MNMSLPVKIILAVIALFILAGVGFYIWMVVAYTPPKGPDNPMQEAITKRGVTGENPAVSYAIGWRGDDTYKVYGVTVGSTKDDLSGEEILKVTGKPVPVDVLAPSTGVVEVLFDGRLASGENKMTFRIDVNAMSPDMLVTIDNGAVIKPAP